MPQLEPYWAAGFSFSRGHFKLRVPYDAYQPMVFQVRAVLLLLLYCTVLYCTGLDWTGLDWTGLDWTGLDWTGLLRNTCLILQVHTHRVLLQTFFFFRARKLTLVFAASPTAMTSTPLETQWCSTSTHR